MKTLLQVRIRRGVRKLQVVTACTPTVGPGV